MSYAATVRLLRFPDIPCTSKLKCDVLVSCCHGDRRRSLWEDSHSWNQGDYTLRVYYREVVSLEFYVWVVEAMVDGTLPLGQPCHLRCGLQMLILKGHYTRQCLCYPGEYTLLLLVVSHFQLGVVL